MRKKRKLFGRTEEPKEEVKKKPRPKNFETTDLDLVYKLTGMGYKLREVKSPFGDRREKLYIFIDSEEKIKEVL